MATGDNSLTAMEVSKRVGILKNIEYVYFVEWINNEIAIRKEVVNEDNQI